MNRGLVSDGGRLGNLERLPLLDRIIARFIGLLAGDDVLLKRADFQILVECGDALADQLGAVEVNRCPSSELLGQRAASFKGGSGSSG
jgi:hypothetical protein